MPFAHEIFRDKRADARIDAHNVRALAYLMRNVDGNMCHSLCIILHVYVESVVLRGDERKNDGLLSCAREAN